MGSRPILNSSNFNCLTNLCNVFPKGSYIILLSIGQKNFKDLFLARHSGLCCVFNLSTWEIEACGALRVCDQPNLRKEFLDRQDYKRDPVSK